jgi:hypothetical protein
MAAITLAHFIAAVDVEDISGHAVRVNSFSLSPSVNYLSLSTRDLASPLAASVVDLQGDGVGARMQLRISAFVATT